ncbi:MAG: carotenoid 1,2-hydratase [Labilithrix sp.]
MVIALLGSPFSPAYAEAREQERDVDPLDFSAFNVCLQRGRTTDWALTERPAHAVTRTRSSLAIGSTSMRWERDALVLEIDERTAPWRSRLRGRVVFRPTLPGLADPIALDGAGVHHWRPVAPLGHVEARFSTPGCSFQGTGYLDTNDGGEPLEEGFSSWSWARTSDGKRVRITYDVHTRDRRELEHGFVLDESGARPFAGRVGRALRRTAFGLRRPLRVAAGETPRLLRTLEDGPFYARSAVEIARPHQSTLVGVHETMSLDRLASRLVRFLIPFRARREA